MGCFSNCFGDSKRRRRSRRRPICAGPTLLHHLQKYESVEDFKITQSADGGRTENFIDPSLIDSPSGSSTDEKREKANLGERKKVRFDSNVTIYEELPKEEEEVEEEAFVNRDLGVNKEEEAPSDSSSSSVFSYPSNHRYQNYRDSDDELDELLMSDESEIDDFTDEEEEEDDEDDIVAQDQSCESVCCLSLEPRKQNSEDNNKSSHSNQNSRFGNSKYVDSVLNPVENLTQWKVMKEKSRRAASRDDREAKENLERAHDLGFKVRKKENEIAVDTSLSGWLGGSSAVTPTDSKNSSISVGNSGLLMTAESVSPRKYEFEDRPILGALTVEEIRELSVSVSPKKGVGWSPDDKPIIGSVGSYWSHTGNSNNKSGSSTRSKFAENAKVIWDPTPFETRLEKALEEASTVELVSRV